MSKVQALAAFRKEFSSPAVADQIKRALPSGIDVERFQRITMTCISQNPALLDCDKGSLFQSIVTVAQLGLSPEPQLGEAYIVPYKGKATTQIGYKGLIKMVRRSGELKSIEAGIIHENDTLEWEMGIESKFSVKPKLGNRGNPIAVFAILRYKDGGFEYEIMTWEEVEEIRKNSPTGNSPAWRNSWGEMAKKTVIRRACKKAPMSTEIARQLAVDEAREERGKVLAVTDDGIEDLDPEQSDGPPPAPKRATRTLEAVAATAEAAVQPTTTVVAGDPQPIPFGEEM
jgi:recombination protein RecT